MRVALDTNILVYAEGVTGEVRTAQAIELIDSIPSEVIVIPTQVLGELFNVMVRKSGVSRSDARLAILGWTTSYTVSSVSEGTFLAAIDLATVHQFTIWDAIIVATAANAGCQVLLSEDMHHGFTWNDVTVVNPFASPRHPLLDRLLRDTR